MEKVIPQLGVSYSIENKLDRQLNPPLNNAWEKFKKFKKFKRVTRVPRTSEKSKVDENKKQKHLHFMTQSHHAARLIRFISKLWYAWGSVTFDSILFTVIMQDKIWVFKDVWESSVEWGAFEGTFPCEVEVTKPFQRISLSIPKFMIIPLELVYFVINVHVNTKAKGNPINAVMRSQSLR